MKHIAFALSLVFAAACGGDSAPALNIEAGDAMSFSTTRLEAPAGQEITLTLRHTGQMPKTAMGHNVVILRPGTDIAAFGAAANEAGAAADYIPAAMEEQIVAHTRIIGGGEHDQIRFTITEAGTYPFICSFPGHFAMMKGELIITAN